MILYFSLYYITTVHMQMMCSYLVQYEANYCFLISVFYKSGLDQSTLRMH